jgi:hypothetical protein
MYTDLVRCSTISGNRIIRAVPTALISAQYITYIGGYLQVYSNTVLARLDLPSLSVMNGYLYITTNSAFTYAHLPKLTYIYGTLSFCANHANFAIPNAPPNAPLGGLVVSNWQKNMKSCYLTQGAGTCGATSFCP